MFEYNLLETGRKIVTTAGTEVALTTTTNGKIVDIQAELNNTGVIAVGLNGVIAAEATRTGIPLSATSNPYRMYISNPSTIYIDSTANGDGVTYNIYG